MKRVVSMLLCVAMVLGFVGCTSTPTAEPSAPAPKAPVGEPAAETTASILGLEETDKLVIWTGYGEGAPVAVIMTELANQFEDLYPNVKVTIHNMGNDLPTALEAAWQSGKDIPDIVDGGDTHVTSWAKNGLLYELDAALQLPSLDDPNTKWVDTLMPSLIESQKYEGKSVMIPWCYYSCGFFYDANLWNKMGFEIPKTWEDMLTLAAKAKEAGLGLVAVDGTLDVYNLWFFTTMAERYVDGNVMRDILNGNGSFKDDPGYLKAAELMAEMASSGMFQNGYEASVYPGCQAVFAQGQAMSHFCGGWLPSEMSSITPDTMDMRVFPLPALPDEVYPNATEVWGNASAIPAGAANKANAVDFLRLLSTKASGNMFVENSIASAVIGTEGVPQVEGYNDFVANATNLYPNSNGMTHVGDYSVRVLGPLSTEIICGRMTAEQFIDELDKQTTEWVANNK